jgi:hypothetical protein
MVGEQAVINVLLVSTSTAMVDQILWRTSCAQLYPEPCCSFLFARRFRSDNLLYGRPSNM